jgi:integral membrane sensor domain MASE1
MTIPQPVAEGIRSDCSARNVSWVFPALPLDRYLIAGGNNLAQIGTALIIATGSMTQAAIGGAALRRTIGYPAPFQKPSDILLFFLVAPIFCLTSATLSLSTLWALDAVKLPEPPMNWVMWWLGDTVGVLAALPLMIWLTDEP